MNPALPKDENANRRKSWVNPALPKAENANRRKSWVNGFDMAKKYILYIDGASRGNPGPAGIGVVILDEKKKKVKELYKYIGETTNNIAEYSALIYGLDEAAKLGANEVVVNMDSELVAKQLNGEYKVKDPNIKALFEKAVSILKNFAGFEIRHIKRLKNKEADKLANKAINLSSLF